MTRPPGPPEPTVDQVISPHPDPLAEISQWFETYGDVYYSVALNTKMYGLRHPDHIHELLVAKVNSFRKREDLTNVLGQGLLTSHGDLWRKQRRLIQPAFDRRRIDGYATEVEREANKLVAQFEHGQTREIERDMRRVTVGIVAGALFSTDVTDYVDEIDRCMMVFQTSREPFAQHRAVKSINRVLFEIIDRRLSRADSQDDLLGWLLTASDGEMSLQQLRDELATFLLAGHETTSIALTWALHLLSENPDVQDSFHDAVDNGDIAYVERVALEALRLYPPSYALPRVALEDTELAGTRSKPGCKWSRSSTTATGIPVGLSIPSGSTPIVSSRVGSLNRALFYPSAPAGGPASASTWRCSS